MPVRFLLLVFLFGAFTMDYANANRMSAGARAAEAMLRALHEEGQTPGVQYLFLSGNEVLFAYAGGIADFEANRPVTSGTTFNGFSITKPFTAAAILRLAADGKLKLDAPLRDYVPNYPYAQSPSVRETLQHTGGFSNPIPIGWIHLSIEEAGFDETAFFDNVFAREGKLASAPGEKFAYSNLGYFLLGLAVGHVSGMHYADYVSHAIIGPLGLRGDDALAFAPNSAVHARGYVKTWSLLNLSLGFFVDRAKFTEGTYHGWTQLKPFAMNGKAYGGITGNAGAFGRYLQAILNASEPFTKEMIDTMFTQGETGEGNPIPYALGWFQGDLDGEPYFAHAGGGGGYYSELRVYPRAKLASVIMFNRSGIRDERFLDKIDGAFFPTAH